MKGNLIIIILLAVMSTNGRSQRSETDEVANAVELFRTGVIEADRNLLDKLTAEQLVYAHSGGKVQDKTAFLEEIVGLQPNDYLDIQIADQTISVSNNTAVVRHIYAAVYLSNGEKGNLRIGNMMIWQKQDGNWRLLARQAYKL